MDSIRYIDIHSHLNFPQFDSDREKIIAEMEREGIATVTVGANLETSRSAVALAQKYPHLFATIGVHPTEAAEGFDAREYEKLLDDKVYPERSRKVVAVGECGLDYFRLEHGTLNIKHQQKKIFEEQIRFALKHDLPLMLHARPSLGTMDAYEDVLKILTADYGLPDTPPRGNFHFFAGDIAVARRALDLGFTLSFDGPITFARDYDEVIRSVPLGMLMAETDAPFAAPAPHRGERNVPLYVEEVVKALAAIRKEDEEPVRCATVENALRVFPRLAAVLR